MRNGLWYCLGFIFSCLVVSSEAYTQLQKIYLHPKAAGSEKQSQVVDSIRFIPLEQIDDIEIGQFSYVKVTAAHFIITEYGEKRIFIYSKNGAFAKKIDYKSLGEGFSPVYHEQSNQLVFFGNNNNYSLTPKDQIKIMLDWSNPRNRKYYKKYVIDLSDTTFTIRKDIPTENDILYAQHFYDDLYWRSQITTSQLYKDSSDYELKLYKDKQLQKGFFPYNRVNEPRFMFTEEEVTVNNTERPNIHFVTRPFCDTIYKIINDSLAPAYHLVLPLENTLPVSFFQQPFKNKTERENFRRNNGWMLSQVHNFYETPRFICFSVQYLQNFETYLYQKQNNSTYKTKNIRADSSQYNLSLLAGHGVERNGDRFYKSEKAGDLLAFFEKHKTALVPKELESFLSSKPKPTAPVIVEFKLKN
jgi:hypothetical protein